MPDEQTPGAAPVGIFATPELALARQKLEEAASRQTSTVTYVSAGHALVVGEPAAALAAGERLLAAGVEGVTAVHVDPAAGRVHKALTERGTALFTVPALRLAGHLGAFSAVAETGVEPGKETGAGAGSAIESESGPGTGAVDLAVSVQRPGGHFDLVLDLSAEPSMTALLPPPGYVHVPVGASGVATDSTDDEPSGPAGDAAAEASGPSAGEEALEEAIGTLGGLVGEFDKPRYFAYDASICAHSRSRLPGCSNCLDVCVTGAISSAGEGVAIDPYLCQGCGSCATLCPTGAMVYAYPKPSDAIRRTREALRESADEHGAPGATTLLLHDEGAAAAVEAAALPADVLPMLVEETSAFGIDYWATVLCAGVGRILIVDDGETRAAGEDVAGPNRRAVEDQAALLRTLLAGLDVGPEVVQLIPSATLTDLDALPGPAPALLALSPADDANGARAGAPGARPAAFATHDDKRQTVRTALDALAAALGFRAGVGDVSGDVAVVPLAAGAPFGHVLVDTDACTLCMACVSTCPAGALLDGQDTPALRMIEANCVQCGLCETACPERAITLEPRYLRDGVEARRVRTLHEETPFHCVTCHKAFATRGMIDTMLGKLAGHWMFTDEKALRRLKMCEDCRVKDIFRGGGQGLDVHAGAADGAANAGSGDGDTPSGSPSGSKGP